MNVNQVLLMDFLPSLTPGELLFAVMIFTGAICILFNIRPVAILGATLLLTIITFVDILGASPFLVILIMLLAAFVRIIGTATGALEDADPVLLTLLTAILGGDSTPETRDEE